MKTLAERIAYVKSITGWSNAELARRAGTSRAAPTDWLNGKVQTLSSVTAQKLSNNSDFSAIWLATGTGEIKKTTLEYAGHTKTDGLIPVAGIAQLGENGWYDQVTTLGADGYVQHYSRDKEAYALKVRGDSMFPAIRHNWYVVVEPNSPLSINEYVAIQLHDGRKMVKELLNHKSNEVIVMSVNGQSRLTISIDEIAAIHSVAAIISPSKHKD